MFKTGLSSCGKEINEELFKAYRDAGIMYMEVSLSENECDTFDYKKASELSQKYGVELYSFHIPFWPFNEIDISLKELCDKSVEYFAHINYTTLGYWNDVSYNNSDIGAYICEWDAE